MTACAGCVWDAEWSVQDLTKSRNLEGSKSTATCQALKQLTGIYTVTCWGDVLAESVCLICLTLVQAFSSQDSVSSPLTSHNYPMDIQFISIYIQTIVPKICTCTYIHTYMAYTHASMHTIPCHAMPCHAMPCHAIPYHTIPYHTYHTYHPYHPYNPCTHAYMHT